MMDFTKLYCRVHPQELVTNYCVKQECQVQLCANCICSHTSFHLGQGSSPCYENIRETYRGLMEKVKEEVSVFQDIKSRVVQIQAKAKEKKEKIREIMRQARQETMELLSIFFQTKEKQLILQIEGADKQYGLHCQARLEKLSKNSTKQIQSLTSMARKINSLNFLENLSKIKTQHLHNARVASSQMKAEVADNENYNTTIVYNKNILREVQQLLENVVIANISREEKAESSRVKVSVSPTTLPISHVSTNKLFEEPKLFTLRRPSSQSSLPTMQMNQKAETKNDYSFKNVFQNNDNTPNESRVTVANKRIGRLEEIQQNESLGTSSTSGFNKNIKEAVLNELPKSNYDFTFGNNIYDYSKNRFSKPTPLRNEHNQSQLMRASEKWQPNQNKFYKPEFVSNFQAKQINNHIDKMQRNQHQNIADSYVDGFQKSSKLNQSRDSSRFMYRTQFL